MRYVKLDGKPDPEGDDYPPVGLVEASVSGGFCSNWLNDGSVYTFSLCEMCLRSIMNGMKVPPRVSCIFGSGAFDYARDREVFEDDLWEANGGKEKRFYEGRCTERNCDKPSKWRFMTGSGTPVDHEATCDRHRRAKAELLGRYSVPREDVMSPLEMWLRYVCVDPDVPQFFYYAPPVLRNFFPEGPLKDNGGQGLSAIWLPKGISLTGTETALTRGMATTDTPFGSVIVGVCDRDAIRALQCSSLRFNEFGDTTEERVERNKASASKWLTTIGSTKVMHFPDLPLAVAPVFGVMPEVDDPDGEMSLLFVPASVPLDDRLSAIVEDGEENYLDVGSVYLLTRPSAKVVEALWPLVETGEAVISAFY
jgi:hypothetical protein